MLIPVEAWSIERMEDLVETGPYVASVKCPMGKKGREGQPCVCYLGTCEYFQYADSKGIECIYNEVETDVIDGHIAI